MRTSTFKSIISILLCMALVMGVCIGALAGTDDNNINGNTPPDYGDNDFFGTSPDEHDINESDPTDYNDDDFFGELPYIPGDLNGDGEVTDQDAIYLLFHTFFASEYPVNQPVDFNGDGEVTDQDAIYLLFHTFFAEDYPITAA